MADDEKKPNSSDQIKRTDTPEKEREKNRDSGRERSVQLPTLLIVLPRLAQVATRSVKKRKNKKQREKTRSFSSQRKRKNQRKRRRISTSRKDLPFQIKTTSSNGSYQTTKKYMPTRIWIRMYWNGIWRSHLWPKTRFIQYCRS